MKLFVDTHVFDDLSQGSKTHLKGIYTSLLRLDTEDEFYFATNSLSSLTGELSLPSNAHHLPYAGHNKLFRLGWEIPQLIKKNKIDWAHFQYISPITKTCKEIVTIHDILFEEYPEYFPLDYRLLKSFLFRRSAKRAEWVLTVSEFSKKALVKYYDLSPEKIIITPNAILDFFWEPQANSSDIRTRHNLQNFILYVSRFEPRKNQVGLLKAYLKLELWRQGIQLVYVGGTGIKTPEFQRCFQSLDEKTKAMIVFLENLPLPDLKWLYESTLLFVYPSFAEGFGIPPLEAIACGANVICSNATAMSEFTFLGDRLFDPGKIDELIQKIEFFLKNPAHSNQQSMRDHVRAHYSWDAGAREILKSFK